MEHRSNSTHVLYMFIKKSVCGLSVRCTHMEHRSNSTHVLYMFIKMKRSVCGLYARCTHMEHRLKAALRRPSQQQDTTHGNRKKSKKKKFCSSERVVFFDQNIYFWQRSFYVLWTNSYSYIIHYLSVQISII